MTIRNASALLPSSLFYKDSIYHYTSGGGFLEEVKNHTLWATEAFGLNDFGELRHGWEFIKTWLAGQDSTDEVVSDLKAWLPDSDDPSEDIGIYLICASTLPDDASQ